MFLAYTSLALVIYFVFYMLQVHEFKVKYCFSFDFLVFKAYVSIWNKVEMVQVCFYYTCQLFFVIIIYFTCNKYQLLKITNES